MVREPGQAGVAGRLGAAGLLLAFVSACTGPETNVNAVYPDIAVVPSAVDFGEVAVGYASTQSVVIANAGAATLDISALSIESESGAVFEVSESGPLQVALNEQVTVEVAFLPAGLTTYAGSLVILSDDEENGELRVPLSGSGVPTPSPDIAIDPESWDFGAVAAGANSLATVIIANEGDATLTLGELAQVGSGAFSIVGPDPSGYGIPGGQSLVLVLAYIPADEEGDAGELQIPSDDADEPVVSVLLEGNGGSAADYPVAAIDCPSPIAPLREVSLSGAASTDGNDPPQTLSFAWSFYAVPEGSALSEFGAPTAEAVSFTPDVAGEFAVDLVVTNADGVRSAPARCRMDAIPDEDLRVELSWDGAAADLDLHLLTSEGVFFERPWDCNYCNDGVDESVDWGVAGEAADDPALALDSDYGYGPENINIVSPADDTYGVLVHYYDDNGDEDVIATIRIYSLGVLVAELSQTMSRNWIWAPGLVNWPDGTFGVLDEYYENLAYDESGVPLDADADGYSDLGPRDCY